MWPFRKKTRATTLPGWLDLPQGHMCRTNPDWIMTIGAPPESIHREITRHGEVTGPDEPATCNVRIFELKQHVHAVLFEPNPPPFDWVNLPGWLLEWLQREGMTVAVGWMTSRSTGIRYQIYPELDNDARDTALALSDDGAIRIYVPEVRVRPTSTPVFSIQEPDLSTVAMTEKARFEMLIDASQSIGNPDFRMTDPLDFKF